MTAPATIPAADLALQCDLCHEPVDLEHADIEWLTRWPDAARKPKRIVEARIVHHVGSGPGGLGCSTWRMRSGELLQQGLMLNDLPLSWTGWGGDQAVWRPFAQAMAVCLDALESNLDVPGREKLIELMWRVLGQRRNVYEVQRGGGT